MSQRRTAAFAAAGALALGAGGVATSGIAGAQGEDGVSGRFSLVMMVHTSSSSFGDLPGVKPWDGARKKTSGFTYRSIPCTGNAPVNNIASDLPSYGTRVKNSRAPSSMRAHPFKFRVRKRRGTWQIVGTITFTVCKLGAGPTPANDPVPDETKPKIRVSFVAPFKREGHELARFRGRFRITGGTQRYQDLTGKGEIAGYLFCFAPQGCTQVGYVYRDAQFTMSGRYKDPTPDLAAG